MGASADNRSENRLGIAASRRRRGWTGATAVIALGALVFSSLQVPPAFAAPEQPNPSVQNEAPPGEPTFAVDVDEGAGEEIVVVEDEADWVEQSSDDASVQEGGPMEPSSAADPASDDAAPAAPTAPAEAPAAEPEESDESDEAPAEAPEEAAGEVDYSSLIEDTLADGPREGQALDTAALTTYGKGLRMQRATMSRHYVDDAPNPEQRLKSVAVTRDLEKRQITAKFNFAKQPTTSRNSGIALVLGLWQGNTCEARVLLSGEGARKNNVSGQFYSSGLRPAGALKASWTRSGSSVVIKSAVNSKVRSTTVNCAWAFNIGPGDTAPVYTDFHYESLQHTYAPKLSITRGDAYQGNYKGRTTKVTFKIRNSGEGHGKNLRIKASGKGLSITKKNRAYSTLKSGSSKSATFKVKVKSGTQRTLKVTATISGGKKVSKTVKIVVRPKPKKPSSLSGNYYWGALPSSLSDYTGWNTRAMYFLNTRWVYLGVPKNGKKPSCKKSSSVCKKYSYNKRTGSLKIGGQKVKVTSEGFSFKVQKSDPKIYMSPLHLPKKGTKFKADLINQDWYGNCMLTCTSFTRRIEFGKNGRFLKTSSSVGSWPGLGSSWAYVSPDQRGKYRITSTGRIELRFANGKKERYLIGFERDIRGKISPNGEGLMLGGTPYY